MQNSLVVFGEVLFDHFPDGSEVLGGAPFNVAWHLQAFGLFPLLVSRVGDDAQGRKIEQAMSDWGLSRRGLQIDGQHPTGAVSIELFDGEPRFSILDRQAYDFIGPIAISKQAIDLLYHGSLAMRHAGSRDSLRQLKELKPGLIFLDVNLRDPWWDRDAVLSNVKEADWLKINDQELQALWPDDVNIDDKMRRIQRDYALQGLIVTRGEQGALAVDGDGATFEVKPETEIDVVDTVGAGDAFAAIMIVGLIKDWSLTLMMQRAQQFASAIVGRRGATVSDSAFYRTLASQWRL